MMITVSYKGEKKGTVTLETATDVIIKAAKLKSVSREAVKQSLIQADVVLIGAFSFKRREEIHNEQNKN